MRSFRLLLCGLLCWPCLASADVALDQVLEELRALEPRRDEPGVPEQVERLHAVARKQSPDAYEVLLSACRWKCWLAYGVKGDRQRDLGKEAWQLGERALARRPGDPAASYCAALGIGAYSQGAGILKSIFEGLEPKYVARLQLTLDRAPGLDAGGPLLAKARYHYEMPWPKKDLAESIRIYEKALAAHPENLRTRLYLAESQLAVGAKESARKSLAKVTSGSVAYDPPEGRRVLQEARKLTLRLREEGK